MLRDGHRDRFFLIGAQRFDHQLTVHDHELDVGKVRVRVREVRRLQLHVVAAGVGALHLCGAAEGEVSHLVQVVVDAHIIARDSFFRAVVGERAAVLRDGHRDRFFRIGTERQDDQVARYVLDVIVHVGRHLFNDLSAGDRVVLFRSFLRVHRRICCVSRCVRICLQLTSIRAGVRLLVRLQVKSVHHVCRRKANNRDLFSQGGIRIVSAGFALLSSVVRVGLILHRDREIDLVDLQPAVRYLERDFKVPVRAAEVSLYKTHRVRSVIIAAETGVDRRYRERIHLFAYNFTGMHQIVHCEIY